MSNLRNAVGRTVAVGALALGSIGMSMTGAHADSRSFNDSRTDRATDANIHKVTVSNENRVVVKVKHNYLDGNPRTVSDEVVFFDLDRRKAGPELKFRLDLVDGTTKLQSMRNWRPVSPRDCHFTVGYDRRNYVTKFRLGRGCLGETGKVRVAVKATSVIYAADPRKVVDWYHGYRDFTPWVKRG